MGTLCVVLIGGAMLSKSLIQFYVNGWGWVPSLLFDLRPNYGAGNEYNVKLLEKVLCRALRPQLCRGQYTTPLWKLLDTHWQVSVSLLCSH